MSLVGTGFTLIASSPGLTDASTSPFGVLAGPVSLATSVITVSNATVASGTGSTLALITKDAQGNRLTSGGLPVSFTNAGGTSTGVISPTTDMGDGTYTATFTGVLAGTATAIGALVGGSPVTSALPTIDVIPGAVSLARSLVTASATSIPVGGLSTLTLTAKDAAGNQLTDGGLPVAFTSSGGTSVGLIGPTTDNRNGTYSATFTGVTIGTPTTIGATIGGNPVTSPLPQITVSLLGSPRQMARRGQTD